MITNQKITSHFENELKLEIERRAAAVIRGKTPEQLTRYDSRIAANTAAIEAGKTADCSRIPDGLLNGNTRLDVVLKTIGVSAEIIEKLFA
jgi:hypothetical protein